MSEKVDAILASGCLEKLLEKGAPEIKDFELCVLLANSKISLTRVT